MKDLVVYLAGEIHSDWREELKQKVEAKGLPFVFVSPQTEHDLSDDTVRSSRRTTWPLL